MTISYEPLSTIDAAMRASGRTVEDIAARTNLPPDVVQGAIDEGGMYPLHVLQAITKVLLGRYGTVDQLWKPRTMSHFGHSIIVGGSIPFRR